MKLSPLSAALLAMFIAGCNDTQVSPTTPAQTLMLQPDDRETGNARKQKEPVAAFVIDGRAYTLVYNTDGTISEIEASQGDVLWYEYKIYYEEGRLIRADLVEEGSVMSSNTNFQYDADGNIISYDYVSYFFPEYPDGLVQSYTVPLNEDGLLSSFEGEPLAYDKKGNLIQVGSTKYSYDNNVNPLSIYPNLWLMLVEESGYALLTLSPHVRTAVQYEDGSMGEYRNEYTRKKMLLSQTLIKDGSQDEIIRFEY